MSKNCLDGFCNCSDNHLLHMGAYFRSGYHWQDEDYPVWCYYCSECGKELQVYAGYHDDETKELYIKSLKYRDILHREAPFVIDVTQMNSDVLYCSLEDKRHLVRGIIQYKHGINSQAGRQLVYLYKKNN